MEPSASGKVGAVAGWAFASGKSGRWRDGASAGPDILPAVPDDLTSAAGITALAAAAIALGAAGTWVPLTTTFPLSDAAGAHRAMEARETVGKTVLLP
jgi:NADPH2:quinone reductase